MQILVNLAGPEGNAFELLALTYRVARHCGLSDASARQIAADMRKGTYIDLLNVMDHEFPGIFRFKSDPGTADRRRRRATENSAA
jgi:hypothetical protein